VTARAHEDIRHLLAGTSIPGPVVDGWLGGAPPLWLASAPPDVLAGDLSLCHPGLDDGETRAMARPLESGGHRLTVVARDRAGLLADTAGAVAATGFSIGAASAVTWSELALHAFTVVPAPGATASWDELGDALRSAGRGARPPSPFRPLGKATVTTSKVLMGAVAKTAVVVEAPDQLGLFGAICAWFADGGHSIDTVHADVGENGSARDVFMVDGDPDAQRLARDLSH
jgi:hypothetical protein